MTCNPTALIESAKSSSGLDDMQFHLMVAALLRQWAATVSPGLDTSPSALMARGARFSGLTSKQMDMVIVQLLCNIRG